MSTIEGRVALVTGASRGIGAAVARSLADAGAKLILASRSGDDLGLDGAVAQRCDVRDPSALRELARAGAERFGGLDIVVANAGVGAYGDFLELDPEVMEEIIDVNVKGLLHTIQATLPYLLESKAADLVVVASIAGQHGPAGEAVYSASKFAQVGFMRSLDHELWERGVRCSTLCPGGVATDFAMGRGRSPDDPDLPGMMRPEEVAESVVWAVTRPRTHRMLEASLLPMAEDSLG
ncbi:MAG: SDR family oxidoreductase [Actinomycetota bacterium]|nr:SDR family oxidoreductase [Actinomycetota bacterium]